MNCPDYDHNNPEWKLGTILVLRETFTTNTLSTALIVERKRREETHGGYLWFGAVLRTKLVWLCSQERNLIFVLSNNVLTSEKFKLIDFWLPPNSIERSFSD